MEQLQKQDISIITPSRNNCVYLKWEYESVREHMGPEVEFCVAVDYSQDDTELWCEEISKKDKNFKYIVNDGTWFGKNKGNLDRMGHCRLFDKLILEVSTKPAFLILHADMRVSKDFIENMLKHLYSGVIVSGTRVEPTIHPPDMAKLQKDFGLEPDEFDLSGFNDYVEEMKIKYKDKTTKGFFAPWLAYKNGFKDIGGHDQETFSYQSREDSDIAQRYMLNGYKLIQARDALCYHLTMRGSRRNPLLTTALEDSNEWLIHNNRSTRNFIRKWGNPPKHDEYLNPIIAPKYNISFVVKNCTMEILSLIEPYCDRVYLNNDIVRNQYVWDEQKATKYDMSKRVLKLSENDPKENDIIVEFDCLRLNQNNIQILQMLPDIITDSGEAGEMEFDIFKFKINSMKTYEHTLIKKVEK